VNRIRAISETVHLSALGVWLGALGLTGVAAAMAFPVMRDLEPTLGAYDAFPREHWPIAAGEIMIRVFQISDLVAVVCCTLAAGSLGLSLIAGKLSLGRFWSRLRILLVVGLVAIQSWAVFALAPRMAHNAGEFWAAAKSGDVERAGEYRMRFGADHPTARRVSQTLVVVILATIVAAGATLAEPRRRGGAS